ncbi:uncharacterized protein EI90DRAFT_1639829 [Cantharellus anzutake]|uniref:uncharacterized protein n=1 Tax=Cantharellus anzutake TaxID=1750568 RepID=UPI001904FF0C|nr:uncharacterized protein EI90DRAFT_1639829 [Cantharellus anzutake]KAF8327890.1 hypothetical protein EI90DRAFT_1639829 [Cantharellus anzutake]
MLKASSDGNHLASRSPSPPATGAAQEAGPKSVAFATTSISRGGEPPFVIHQSERTLNRTSRSPSPLASQESSAQIIPARTQISSGNDRNLNTELDTAGMQKAE